MVGSPASPGPNRTTSSPSATAVSAKSTTNWFMQTVPEIVQRRPRTCTCPVLVARRGTPSAYPSGTRPSVVSRRVV
jgi:hypothetical protein